MQDFNCQRTSNENLKLKEVLFHSIDFNTAYVYAVLVKTIVNDNIHYLNTC